MGINTENINRKIRRNPDKEKLNILFVGRFSEKKESIY